jgi:hypothetical protein
MAPHMNFENSFINMLTLEMEDEDDNLFDWCPQTGNRTGKYC